MVRRTCALVSIALALSTLTSTDAMATAQRTFVASSGNDTNPCSLPMPCRTFGAAIVQTLSGGEVIVLDSAGYGPVVISQSVTIIAPDGVYAGISVPAGQSGVSVNGVNVNVVLHGLTLNSTGGDSGIRMVDGARLAVENCVISNFGPGVGTAISIEAAAAVNIAGSVIRDNALGILAGFGASVSVVNSQITGNLFEGIQIFGGSAGTVTNINIVDTLVTGTGQGGVSRCVDNNATSGTTGNISAIRVTVSNCGWGFVNTPATAGTITVSNSMVTGNAHGFLHGFVSAFYTLANSDVSGNTIDTSGTITTIGGK